MKKTAELHTYDEMHGYYFRFEAETHHAGEYQNYIEEFASCLFQGKTPKPDLEEGIRTIAVLEAIDESMRTGKVVKVDEVLAKYLG